MYIWQKNKCLGIVMVLIIWHQLRELKYCGGRHYKSIYGISIWLWVYCIQYFLLLERFYSCTIIPSQQHREWQFIWHFVATKIYQNPYKLMQLSKYKFPIFQEVKQRGMFWWHGMLMHICLVFCLQPLVNTLGIWQSNVIAEQIFQFNHIVKFWV
jgi:hypothetical protein